MTSILTLTCREEIKIATLVKSDDLSEIIRYLINTPLSLVNMPLYIVTCH